ncbi:MAG: hypothetical protein ABFS43_15225 [Thermodesulfobacteriota bacterium]
MIFLLMHCSSTRDMDHSRRSHPADVSGNDYYQTPASKYTVEILSYMMQVVVGVAGDPANREDWKTRSLSVDLDLSQVGYIMQDPERKVSELMVYDANILGLSKVLFHYNQRLNYFKGRRFQESLYPSEELLAIRLFMVQKIARGEKARMGNLMAQPALLEDSSTEPSLAALAMANLNAEELRLLQDVIHSEPFFKDYLEDPFMVEALHRVGIVETDGYVKSKIKAADYSRLAAEYTREARPENVVRVAILPSLTRSFDVQAKADADFPLGFRANDDYVLAVETLKAKLAAAIQHRLADGLDGEEGDSLSLAEKDKKAADMVNTHLQFFELDKRPLVIYPENAEKAIQSLCPDADFNFIILGKNVYLSMYIDEERDVFPSVNRIYLDIMDIGQSQSDYEIDQVGDYLFSRIKAFIQ